MTTQEGALARGLVSLRHKKNKFIKKINVKDLVTDQVRTTTSDLTCGKQLLNGIALDFKPSAQLLPYTEISRVHLCIMINGNKTSLRFKWGLPGTLISGVPARASLAISFYF